MTTSAHPSLPPSLPPSPPLQVFAGYDGGSSYTVPSKEDLSKVMGRSFSS